MYTISVSRVINILNVIL